MNSLLENTNLEFKEAVPSDSLKYTKTVAAFANSNGGSLIFGVRDTDRKTVGLDMHNVFVEADRITNAICDSISPSVDFQINTKEEEGKTLLVVEVFPGKNRPYFVKSLGLENGVFVRIGGTTRQADLIVSKELFFENRNISWDCEICEDHLLTENDLALFEKNCSSEITEAMLRSWGLISEKNGSFFMTNGFALLSGQMKNPPILQCAAFRGTDRSEFLDRKVFSGPLVSNYEDAVKFLFANTRTAARITGFTRTEEQDIPDEVLRELVINTVVHRSYISDQASFIGIYSDRLEIITPGKLPGGLTTQMMIQGFSKIRNRGICRVFMQLGLMEGWGSGIPRITKELSKRGLPEPEIEDLGDQLRITIRRRRIDYEVREAKPLYLSSLQARKEVLNLIKENPFITQEIISSTLGLSLSSVKRIISELQKARVIAREGNNRRGFWNLLM